MSPLLLIMGTRNKLIEAFVNNERAFSVRPTDRELRRLRLAAPRCACALVLQRPDASRRQPAASQALGATHHEEDIGDQSEVA